MVYAIDTAVDFLCFSSIEETLAIVCANIPIIIGLFQRSTPDTTTAMRPTYNHTGRGSNLRYFPAIISKNPPKMGFGHGPSIKHNNSENRLEDSGHSLDELRLVNGSQARNMASAWTENTPGHFCADDAVFITHHVSIYHALQ